MYMHTNPRFAQSAVYAGFRVALVELRPIPMEGERIRPEDYRATLLVER